MFHSIAGQLAGVLFFLIALAGVSLSNLVLLRRLSEARPLGAEPPVSILVPARNEAANITRCVNSLLEQDYTDFEVLVLDDHSTDNTGEILAELCKEDPRLKVLNGKALPPGWMGKNWACHQLAQAARGQLLLFTDADTIHHPWTLREAVALLQKEQAHLLSAIPHQELGSWGERLVVPVMAWSLHSFLPIFLAEQLPWPVMAAAVGQFMLFRRFAYEVIGGHASVRAEITEDNPLARRIKAYGFRWRLVDGSQRVRTRMYRGWGEVYHGFSRSLFPAFDYRVLPYLFIWTWSLVVFIEPLIIFFLGIAKVQFPLLVIHMAALSIGLSLGLWLIALIRFGSPLSLALFYPLSIILFVFLAFRSFYLTLTGRSQWKGRALSPPQIRLW